jgi:pimeloyl-ACP methyl ester carboxylesterase
MGDPRDADLVRLPDGRRAQLWQGGARVGPTVFFLHGCPDTRHAARPGDDAARRAGVRLVAVNRPGYGRSDPDESGHASVADDVVAIADLLDVGRFAVLGMSVGGPYALACAARHPERVTAAGVVAAPAVVPELDPPCHRDDLSAKQQAFFARLAASTVAEAVDLVRPDYQAFVARILPQDNGDRALVARWIGGLPAQDAELLEALPTADVATAVREALANLDGYLRDAAVTFRAWEVRPELVRCPTWLWYGDLDTNASVRNGWWFAEHIATATLVVRSQTTHLATLIKHWDEILTTLRDAG